MLVFGYRRQVGSFLMLGVGTGDGPDVTHLCFEFAVSAVIQRDFVARAESQSSFSPAVKEEDDEDQQQRQKICENPHQPIVS